MSVLDTSFLIDLLRGKDGAKAILKDLEDSDLFLGSPSLMELWCGAALSNSSVSEKNKIYELLGSLNLLPLDDDSAKDAGEIEAFLIKKGLQIQVENIMIAGIARSKGKKVVSRDSDYSRIPGLKVLKY
jgi:predicted nucleic acid-binding protein